MMTGISRSLFVGLCAALILTAACGDDERNEAAIDAGTSDVATSDTATADAGDDAASDSGADAALDSGADATDDETTVAGNIDTTLGANQGVGLFWQSALFSDPGAPAQYLPDRQFVSLSPTSADGTSLTFEPVSQPDPSLHIYKAVCDSVGQQVCDDEGVDDDTPLYALVKLAVVEDLNADGQIDCTYADISSESGCGSELSVVAWSGQHMLLYAYTSVEPSTDPFLGDWGVTETVEPGWHVVNFRSKSDVELVGLEQAVEFSTDAVAPNVF